MSCYVDIYSDFPSRCQQIWERIERSAKKETRDLSVTAMLVAAAAGFATPWEHLRDKDAKQNPPWKDHPAFKDVTQEKYDKTLKRFSSKISESLVESLFFL
ncbi:MAG: hypothetical protein ACKVKM_13900, partial [Verrucomicrobiia bacterium]